MSDSLYEAQVLAAKYKAERDAARQELDRVREELEAMRPRLMPEGYEWPCYEDGEPVSIGDKATLYEEDFDVRYIGPYSDGSFCLNFLVYPKGERVKRPAVLAADGEPLEAGQTVWDENGDELVVLAIYGQDVHCRYAEYDDQICDNGAWEPSQLTHAKPERDSWERIEEDAERIDETRLWGDRTPDARGLVRRCKALAERGSDEQV